MSQTQNANQHVSGFQVVPDFEVTVSQMEELAKNFKSKINLQQEPTAELREALTIMQQATVNQDLFKGDDSARKFFFNDFVGRIIKTLVLSIKINCTKDDFKEAVREVPKTLAYLLCQNLDNASLVDGCLKFFDHKSRIF